MFEAGVVRAISDYHSARSGGIRVFFSIFFNTNVCCVFSIELPRRGDSNEYKQYFIFNIKKKITLNCPKSATMGFFQVTQERVRNSCGKRGATEVLLYTYPIFSIYDQHAHEDNDQFKFICRVQKTVSQILLVCSLFTLFPNGFFLETLAIKARRARTAQKYTHATTVKQGCLAVTGVGKFPP